MKGVYESIGRFVKRAFPNADSRDHLRKLIQEAREAIAEPENVTEYADCFIALAGAAKKAGLSFESFHAEVKSKLEVCEERDWEEQPDGTFQHVSDEPTFLEQVQTAFADFYAAMGCGCCADYEGLKKAGDRIGELLQAPRYDDDSGYDFWQFRTPRKEAQDDNE